MIVALALPTVGCARAEMSMSGKTTQTFEFGNDGQGVIADPRIQYGKFIIPSRTGNNKFSPNHAATYSEGMTVPVPQTAEIRWTSADGKMHTVNAPIGKFVANSECFYGFRFMFVDDHVDVYIINRTIDCGRFLNIERTKVFSSPPDK